MIDSVVDKVVPAVAMAAVGFDYAGLALSTSGVNTVAETIVVVVDLVVLALFAKHIENVKS